VRTFQGPTAVKPGFLRKVGSIALGVVAVATLTAATGTAAAAGSTHAGKVPVVADDQNNPQGVDSARRPLQPSGQAANGVQAADPGPPISRSEIIARAQTWLNPPVPYSQDAYKDGYRTDCSGYVSMAWHLNRNYWTGDLHTVGVAIQFLDLRAGDMLLYHNPSNPVNGSHVVLFDRWVGSPGGDFYMYEQTPPNTLHRKWSQTQGRVLSNYKPFRYANLIESQAGRGAVSVVFGGEYHVLATTAGGSVLDSWYSSTGWHSQNLGGIIQGSPSVVVYNGQFHVFGANGGQVFQTWYGGGVWHAWVPVSTGSDPTATVYTSGGVAEMHVTSRAGNGNVIDAWYSGTGWHSQNLGGIIQGRPAVVVYNGQFHVFGANGGQVFQTWYGGGVWHAWVPVSTGSDPTATVYTSGGVAEMHVTSRAGNGNLTDAWYSSTGWHTQTLGGYA
jgi:hypothetical protein